MMTVSVFLSFKKKGGGSVIHSPPLDVQVKCTQSANSHAFRKACPLTFKTMRSFVRQTCLFIEY